MIVLDTNVISELLRSSPNKNVLSFVSSMDDETAITAVTVAELLAGIERLPQGKRKDELAARVGAAVKEFDRRGSVLSFDVPAAQRYAVIVARRLGAGRPISSEDAQIASMCAAHGAVCATRNIKDFEGTGIQLVNPWDAT